MRQHKPVRILAADDSPTNRALLRSFASLAGFDMEVASDGREAVELFQKGNFSVVMLDIHMPELDGFQALDRMRQIEREKASPRTPIIALTGSSFREDGKICLDAGFDDFVEKTGNPKVLTAVIRKHVEAAEVEADTIRLDESLKHLLPGYLRQRKRDAERIRKALQTKRFEEIENLGHRMKGSGKCYGMAKISALGHCIEASAKARDTRAIEKALGQVVDYLARIKPD